MQNLRVHFLALIAFSLIARSVNSATYRLPIGLENPNARLQVAEEYLNYRLPNNTYPEHYDLTLTTNVHTGDRDFTGTVIIDIVIVEPTREIVLHAKQLEGFQVSIRNPSTGQSEDLLYSYELEREFLTLKRKIDTPFPANSKWQLTIAYKGQLRKDNKGFYLSSYLDDEGKTHYLATTQYESVEARHGFPCYDEPAKRAKFTITINHSPTYTAVSNMPVNEILSSPGKTVFLTTDPIPTYIVAYIVSDFGYTEGILDGLPHRLYSRPNAKHEHEWAVVSAMLITERLSEYYNVSFFLPKMDQAAIPDFSAGGMENWGLATYREEYMFYDKDINTVFRQTSIASISAHEICHQWFGDYVAIKWWSYMWLKEGFAALFSYKALDDAYPEWGVWQQFHANDYQNSLKRDGVNSPRPMTYYVQTPKEIASIYDYVPYDKSAVVLFMWSNALTEKVFKRGLHNYLTANQYSAAEEEQLFTALQTAAKEENYKLPATMSEMFGSWSRQGGYPLLTVTRNYNDGTFTVKQQAYHDDETFRDDKLWFVPINYAVASNPDFRNTEASHYLLNVSEIKVQDAKVAKDDWLILNKQSTGFYRITYDLENWNLIVDGLIKRPYKIHSRNRAQLMHDAYHLSASKRLDYSVLLKMMTYLKQEDQYAAWATANGILTTYNRYLNGDDKYDDLKFFIAEQLAPTFDKLGVDDNPGEQHYQKHTRNIIINLACLGDYKNCLLETNRKLKDWLKYNITVEPNVQAPIYCNGLKQASDEEFNFVYNNLMDSQDSTVRRQFITALGCAQNENHIRKYISSSIDKSNKLRPTERYTLLNPVYSRGEQGLLACIDFLNDNWNEYGKLKSDIGGSNPLDDDIRGMASYVVNQKQEEKLLALVAKVKNTEHATATLESTVKSRIASNFEWLKQHRTPIMSWLTEYRAGLSGNENDGNGNGGNGNDGNGNGGNGNGGGSANIAASTILLVMGIFICFLGLY